MQVANPFLRIKAHRSLPCTEVEVRVKDLARAYEAAKKYTGYINYARDSAWIGATDSQCATMLAKGDIAQVVAAEAFAKEVDKKLDVETCAPEMQSTVAGGAFSTAAFLSGNPNCFRRPRPVTDVRKPLRIFVDIGASAGVSAATIQKRGRALLAMAKVLSKSRPVELVAFTYVRLMRRDVLVKVPLGLNNWAMAGAVLGNSAFFREPIFRIVREIVGTKTECMIGWPKQYDSSETVPPEVVGAARNDAIFGRAFLHNRAFTADPVKWVAGEIERINKMQKGQ